MVAIPKPIKQKAPLLETGELLNIKDLSEALAWIAVAMSRLNLTWQSERMVRFLEHVEQRSGKQCKHPNQIPCEAVIVLAKRLATELGREDIGDRFS